MPQLSARHRFSNVERLLSTHLLGRPFTDTPYKSVGFFGTIGHCELGGRGTQLYTDVRVAFYRARSNITLN